MRYGMTIVRLSRDLHVKVTLQSCARPSTLGLGGSGSGGTGGRNNSCREKFCPQPGTQPFIPVISSFYSINPPRQRRTATLFHATKPNNCAGKPRNQVRDCILRNPPVISAFCTCRLPTLLSLTAPNCYSQSNPLPPKLKPKVKLIQLSDTLDAIMGISRDSRHKRSASGAKRAFYRASPP